MRPGGSFRAKKPLSGLFLMFLQNAIMYVVIVFFMVLNSNLQVSIPETLLFTFFGMRFPSPGAEIYPKMSIFIKKALFWPIHFD